MTETGDFPRPIYVPTPAEMAEFVAATASVATEWEAYMVGTLEFPEGLLARYIELLDEYETL